VTDTCRRCGKRWVNYLVEDPHMSHSGRWWRAPLPKKAAVDLSAEEARRYLQEQEWCYVGGSFYGGKISKEPFPISVA